jgi:hypothetical protein
MPVHRDCKVGYSEDVRDFIQAHTPVAVASPKDASDQLADYIQNLAVKELLQQEYGHDIIPEGDWTPDSDEADDADEADVDVALTEEDGGLDEMAPESTEA